MSHPNPALFVGRHRELEELRAGHVAAQEGHGSFWLVSGPIGIGKSTLLGHLEREARQAGFTVLSGRVLRDPPSPLAAFEHLFSPLPPVGSAPPPESTSRAPASFVILEQERPAQFWPALAALRPAGPCVVVTRDRRAVPAGSPAANGAAVQVLRLSRGEGADHVSPANLDAIGQRLEEHLRAVPGGTVALPEVEYLVVQNSFLAVLRLLQYLRESAETTGGQVVVSLNPRSLDAKERALIEAEGEIGNVSPAPPSRPSPASEPSPALGPRLLRYLDRIEEAARHRPLLLLLDDLQWADAQSAHTLQFLVRNTRSLPVQIVGAMRTEYLEGSHIGGVPVNESLDRLARDRLLHRVALPGLTLEHQARMLEGLLGGPLAVAAREDSPLADVLRPTQGNPLFLRELTENLVERGWLVQTGGSWILSLPVMDGHRMPSTASLHRLVSQRLLRLSRQEREWIETAALVGLYFDLDPVNAALGVPAEDGQKIAAGLSGRGALVTPPSGGSGPWSFAHPFLWEKVLEETPALRGQALASSLAKWWSTTRPEEWDTIARLYQGAGPSPEALEWTRRGIERALQTHHRPSLERSARWLVDWLGSGPAEGVAWLDPALALAEGLRALGAPTEAERLVRALHHEGWPPPGGWKVSLALADILIEEARLEEAEAVLQATRKELEGAPGAVLPEIDARFEIVRADLRMHQGDPGSAGRGASRGLELLGTSGEPRWRSRALDLLGRIHLRQGDLDGAARSFSEGEELSRRLGLPRELALHREGKGEVEWRKGRLEAARECFEDAIAGARATGDVPSTAAHLLDLARVLEHSGKGPEAERAILESLKVSEQFDLLWSAGTALLRLGERETARGRWSDAREHVGLALNRFTLAGDARSRREARWLLLRLRGETGDPRGALEELRQEPPEEGAGHVTEGRLRELVGDVAGARRALEQAWEESEDLPLPEKAVLRREQARLERVAGEAGRAIEMEEEASRLGPPRPDTGRMRSI